LTTALVIGACGFTGRHLVAELRARGYGVVGADILPLASPDVAVDDYRQVDICDRAQVSALISSVAPELVFNLVALVNGDPADIYRVNLMGSVHVVGSVIDICPGSRVLLVGSAAEYGPVDESDLPIEEEHKCRPINHYGASKCAMTAAAQAFARQSQAKVVIARPTNIIGAGIPKSLVLGAILDRARMALERMQEPVVKVGNLDTKRDFVDVEDVVRAYLLMIEGDAWGEVFNVCSGKATAVRDLVEKALALAPRKIRIETDPDLCRKGDAGAVYASPEKARARFGFVPTVSVDGSIRQAWDCAMRQTPAADVVSVENAN